MVKVSSSSITTCPPHPPNDPETIIRCWGHKYLPMWSTPKMMKDYDIYLASCGVVGFHFQMKCCRTSSWVELAHLLQVKCCFRLSEIWIEWKFWYKLLLLMMMMMMKIVAYCCCWLVTYLQQHHDGLLSPIKIQQLSCPPTSNDVNGLK